MTDKIYTIDEIKSIVIPIAEQHGAQRVFLFGSYCRGEQTEESDLDFRLDKGKMTGFFSIGSFRADLEDAFEKEVDVLTTASLSSEFLANIKKDEVLIYEQRDAAPTAIAAFV